jgi:hypothetical protein
LIINSFDAFIFPSITLLSSNILSFNKILEDKSVIEGVEEICKKIKKYKDKFSKLWYDFFISDIINFLKKKNVEYNENVNRLNKELFKEIENFNKTKFNCNEEYVNKKNELRTKIDSFYEEKKRSLEKRFKDERRNFCKQPTKSLIQNISERNSSNEIRIYKKSNNEETSNKQEILDDLFDFYQQLLGNERVKEEITKSYNIFLVFHYHLNHRYLSFHCLI